MFRMPKFGNPGQVEDGCSPQQEDHPLHPVILSKRVRSGPVIPSKPTESRACPVFGSLTMQWLNGDRRQKGRDVLFDRMTGCSGCRGLRIRARSWTAVHLNKEIILSNLSSCQRRSVLVRSSRRSVDRGQSVPEFVHYRGQLPARYFVPSSRGL